MERGDAIRSNQPAMKSNAHGRRPLARALKLPHERDESADPSAPRQAVMTRAAGDLAAGRVDTDNYTRAAGVAAAATKRRRTPS
jgi:hypothetical protein